MASLYVLLLCDAINQYDENSTEHKAVESLKNASNADKFE